MLVEQVMNQQHNMLFNEVKLKRNIEEASLMAVSQASKEIPLILYRNIRKHYMVNCRILYYYWLARPWPCGNRHECICIRMYTSTLYIRTVISLFLL